MKALMRYYSYLFHLLLALFLLAVSGLALASGSPALHLGMLPWTGQTLTYVLFFGALAGLIAILLAMTGVLRLLFGLWSLLIVFFLVKGYIFSGYKFEGTEFRTSLYLIVASLIALPGAWIRIRPARKY
jgi:hypothetical protein